MFFTISFKPLKPKWRIVIKIGVLLACLCYIIPKLVLSISGIGRPPANHKLRDEPVKEGPMKVELMQKYQSKIQYPNVFT